MVEAADVIVVVASDTNLSSRGTAETVRAKARRPPAVMNLAMFDVMGGGGGACGAKVVDSFFPGGLCSRLYINIFIWCTDMSQQFGSKIKIPRSWLLLTSSWQIAHLTYIGRGSSREHHQEMQIACGVAEPNRSHALHHDEFDWGRELVNLSDPL